MEQDERTVDGVSLADLRHLNQACADAIDRIAEADTNQEAFEANTALIKRIDEYRAGALKSRDQSIATIWQTEEFALAALAKRVGLSKARADQIVREQTGRPTYPSIDARKTASKEIPDEPDDRHP